MVTCEVFWLSLTTRRNPNRSPLQLVKVIVMTDEERHEWARRQSEGMRQRGPLTNGEQEALAQASMNFWRQEGPFTPVPIQPPPTLWARFKRWIRG